MSNETKDQPQSETQTASQPLDVETMLNTVLKLTTIIETTALLEYAIETILSITGAERGVVVFPGENGEPEVVASKNPDQKFLDSGHSKRVFKTLLGTLSATNEAKMSSNVQEDSQYKPSDSLFGVTLRSILAIPLTSNEKFIGVLYVEQSLRKGPFEKLALSMNILQSLASIVAINYERLKALEQASS